MPDNKQNAILTLDAGGTSFVFSAIVDNKEAVEPICSEAFPADLKKCLDSMVVSFKKVIDRLNSYPSAISFAFPGPADYENGVIGDLPNFPAFRGGVALGPYLEEKFNIPVFINNDGNLFAYGEAIAGALPELNSELTVKGNPKQYKNLLAVTLGTGFGGGVVIDGKLLRGDNGCGGDVWLSANKLDNFLLAEEGVSIRAVKRVYREISGDDTEYTPKDIFEIAEGEREGDRDAAIVSFERLGEVAGFAISESLNIVDGIVVVGGGISKASKYILPSMIREMNSVRKNTAGDIFPRMQMKAYNLEDEKERLLFMKDDSKTVTIPESNKTVVYHQTKKVGVMTTRLGTSKAIAIGAYNFAKNQLNINSAENR
ncbi:MULTISPECIES: ROK family protein [Proteiniphilum]|jgi:glucokinase|uniref:ROK family protein n=1 Tax=Proteiniphilum TaxID=294702 RepID=UPI001EE9E787|nr:MULTISPECIES: ROK family protein [Proteiniphilum]ULB33534.1 ROK family protein [Proteiniphilum propionicum]